MERGTRGFFLGVVVALLTASPTDAAVDLEFDYRYDTTGFFAAGSEARESLLAAGDFYESNLNDTLTAIASYGGNHFNAVVRRPDSGVEVTINDFDVQDSKVYVFVGARNLGGSTLGLGGPCGWSGSYVSPSWIDNVRTRGQGSVDDVIGDTAIDYAPWGGSIALDIDSAWHDDPTRNPSGSNNDLYSTLVHELGHVLGIGISDSWYNLINAGNQFTGAASVAEYGGNRAAHSRRSPLGRRDHEHRLRRRSEPGHRDEPVHHDRHAKGVHRVGRGRDGRPRLDDQPGPRLEQIRRRRVRHRRQLEHRRADRPGHGPVRAGRDLHRYVQRQPRRLNRSRSTAATSRLPLPEEPTRPTISTSPARARRCASAAARCDWSARASSPPAPP